mmetsp:Transcript_27128/g.71367  ORF Transcript_27128/g.71367 Transcript_27128/m.71367 type:complete len:262 (+) Transcript_27128:84-869(+)
MAIGLPFGQLGANTSAVLLPCFFGVVEWHRQSKLNTHHQARPRPHQKKNMQVGQQRVRLSPMCGNSVRSSLADHLHWTVQQPKCFFLSTYPYQHAVAICSSGMWIWPSPKASAALKTMSSSSSVTSLPPFKSVKYALTSSLESLPVFDTSYFSTILCISSRLSTYVIQHAIASCSSPASMQPSPALSATLMTQSVSSSLGCVPSGVELSMAVSNSMTCARSNFPLLFLSNFLIILLSLTLRSYSFQDCSIRALSTWIAEPP